MLHPCLTSSVLSHQMGEQVSVHDDVDLVRRAAQGEVPARKALTHLVHDIVSTTNSRYCKMYCLQHRNNYICTVDKQWGRSTQTDALLCEWGNGSYAWILDDLTKSARLKRFKGTSQGGFRAYIYTIVRSLPFRERWRDWRFGRRIKVPLYIRALDPDANKVFLWLREGDEIPNIAQRLGRDSHEIKKIAASIMLELVQRGRLHVLDPPQTVSLSHLSDEIEDDIPSHDITPEDRDAQARIRAAWNTLTAEERFVVEAMKVDELDAKTVLNSLCHFGLSIKKGVAPEHTTVQQVYYFFRKSWEKLAKNSGLLTDD